MLSLCLKIYRNPSFGCLNPHLLLVSDQTVRCHVAIPCLPWPWSVPEDPGGWLPTAELICPWVTMVNPKKNWVFTEQNHAFFRNNLKLNCGKTSCLKMCCKTMHTEAGLPENHCLFLYVSGAPCFAMQQFQHLSGDWIPDLARIAIISAPIIHEGKWFWRPDYKYFTTSGISRGPNLKAWNSSPETVCMNFVKGPQWRQLNTKQEF